MPMTNDPPTCSTNSSSLRQPSSPTLPDPSRRNARSMVPPHVRGTVATCVKREGRDRWRGKTLLNIAVHKKCCRHSSTRKHTKTHSDLTRVAYLQVWYPGVRWAAPRVLQPVPSRTPSHLSKLSHIHIVPTQHLLMVHQARTTQGHASGGDGSVSKEDEKNIVMLVSEPLEAQGCGFMDDRVSASNGGDV